MARRRYARRAYRYAAPRARRYARGGGLKGMLGGAATKPIVDGLLAGAGGQILTKWLGNWGHPVATVGVGLWQNNNALKTEGARELGAMLATMLPFVGGGRTPGGVY